MDMEVFEKKLLRGFLGSFQNGRQMCYIIYWTFLYIQLEETKFGTVISFHTLRRYGYGGIWKRNAYRSLNSFQNGRHMGYGRYGAF